MIEKSRSGIILSAFLSKVASDWLALQNLETSTIVVRGQIVDFASGAVSIAALRSILIAGHTVKLNFELHAKVFQFGDEILLGSSNLTGRGLHILSSGGNIELNNVIQATEQNQDVINKIVQSSINLDLKCLKKMEDFLQLQPNEGTIDGVDWPSDLFPIKEFQLNILDFPNYSIEESVHHDLEYWGEISRNFASGNVEKAELCLRDTNVIFWLIGIIKSQGDKGISFGWLSKQIHSEVQNNPDLRRKDIKRLQQNLYSYLRELEIGITILQPRHSEVLFLTS